MYSGGNKDIPGPCEMKVVADSKASGHLGIERLGFSCLKTYWSLINFCHLRIFFGEYLSLVQVITDFFSPYKLRLSLYKGTPTNSLKIKSLLWGRAAGCSGGSMMFVSAGPGFECLRPHFHL